MAEEADDDIEVDEGGDAGEAEPKKGGLKKLLLFVGLPVVILLLGGVAGGLLLLGGGEDEAVAETEEAEEVDEVDAMVAELDALHYTMFEDITVDVEGEDGRLLAMLVTFAVVYQDEDVRRVIEHEAMTDRLRNTYIEFLRTLRPDDIYGSMGTFRLRAELLRRTNLEIAPLSADQVLIEDLLIN